MTVIDLSPSMKIRVADWKRMGHNLDTNLLFQCAYYPRGGCQDCSWEHPNQACKWSHLLTDTRLNQPTFQSKKKSKKQGRKFNIEGLISKLPAEVQEEIRKIIEGR